MRETNACEIVYWKDEKGWKWRGLQVDGKPRPQLCSETYGLFYECVLAARASGYDPRIKCA